MATEATEQTRPASVQSLVTVGPRLETEQRAWLIIWVEDTLPQIINPELCC